ncbi:anaerobic ribonucleoside-triphosphate reductase activating protein [candidate division WOR-1 bacterium RIFCSPHIGHO2_01_FULL_53_15]|uniref:Anaerobic ribonucleoside-triphosphate reductase activating protein n=1 Tax=candidate division WOR-1 bacterium RIFCSPHIGHO2_01_FULL_53_15 TaxID=1802564 RepID=A0A1F4Q1W0_UNCSA|nr:MAG: anaerobic ribonucleoside-triphosphate reductase activating protein [candidate division WOR-1 bacterium RIFCSPHIGHO2_01_FULL_53_15]OGC13105.1 MAG: anaerobic ribonucleoside-triphosphate reductase activating protein [candidate division WOR-1 bacterium RIFCSPHIGHO2_02_FULL_53_26]
MNIRGFIETSFLDWDGKISSVVFLPYCNFKCPFCDNGLLIENPEADLPEVKLEAVDDFIKRRKDFIDGIVISGGEPTIHPWLTDLIRHFKEKGMLVKLDTNGASPNQLTNLLTSKLIDYIAMDIKAPFNDKYHAAAGQKIDLGKVRESVKLIMNSGLDYEFRTTVVPTILDEPEIEAMARSIAGAKKYALQQFVPDHTLDERLRMIAPHPKEKILKMAEIAKKHIANTIVRGV